MAVPSSYSLNDGPINFVLWDDLKFYLNDQAINFKLNAIVVPGENFRLLEDDYYRLLEDDTFRILE